MTAIPVTVGEVRYDSYIAAQHIFSEMLQRYRPKDNVNNVDAALLHDLIKRHPRSGAKIGLGIAHFQVRTKKHGAKCFHIVRTDGTVEEFSYKRCIKGK